MEIALITLGALAAVGALALALLGGLNWASAACKRWTKRAEAKEKRRRQDALRRVLTTIGLQDMVADTIRFPVIRDDTAPGGVGRAPDLAHLAGFQQAKPSTSSPSATVGSAERSTPVVIESGSNRRADRDPPPLGCCVASTPLAATGGKDAGLELPIEPCRNRGTCGARYGPQRPERARGPERATQARLADPGADKPQAPPDRQPITRQADREGRLAISLVPLPDVFGSDRVAS